MYNVQFLTLTTPTLRERSGRCRNSASPFNLKSETLFKLKDYILKLVKKGLRD
ncbi:MAG: hypothetical protein LBC86_02380 [Oscillospiraceae bacterium]|jgi:hypothetical protein|nr:hypothetical protein [Oscillospiraceae bacterium]